MIRSVIKSENENDLQIAQMKEKRANQFFEGTQTKLNDKEKFQVTLVQSYLPQNTLPPIVNHPYAGIDNGTSNRFLRQIYHVSPQIIFDCTNI